MLHCRFTSHCPTAHCPAPSHLPTQIVMHSFQPGGLVGRLCAPREMCCVRSWRQVGPACGRGCRVARDVSRASWQMLCAVPWLLCVPLPAHTHAASFRTSVAAPMCCVRAFVCTHQFSVLLCNPAAGPGRHVHHPVPVHQPPQGTARQGRPAPVSAALLGLWLVHLKGSGMLRLGAGKMLRLPLRCASAGLGFPLLHRLTRCPAPLCLPAPVQLEGAGAGQRAGGRFHRLAAAAALHG